MEMKEWIIPKMVEVLPQWKKWWTFPHCLETYFWELRQKLGCQLQNGVATPTGTKKVTQKKLFFENRYKL